VHVEYRLVDALAVGPGETEGIVPVPEVQLVLAETKDHHGITDRYDLAPSGLHGPSFWDLQEVSEPFVEG